jgi:glycosyltransferase involved in cell wall biosynthesis
VRSLQDSSVPTHDLPLRIEMVVPSLVRAGMETMVARMAIGLVARGHDVGITCLEHDGELAVQVREAGVTVRTVSTPGLRTNIRAPALEKWFTDRAPDVIHSHSGAWLKSARAARRAGVRRVVHTIHGIEGREPLHLRAMMRIASLYTDQIVVVSESLRNYLASGCGIPTARVLTISNGVDLAAYEPTANQAAVLDAALERSREWKDDMIIGHVARLSPVKNQQLLIEAFGTVAARRDDVRLVIVGDGPLRGVLMRQVEELGLTDRVNFVGATADVQSWLALFDLFVLSSDQEGTSMSILEALATGVCVAATAVGGTPALLDGGRAGLLVPPRNPALLAEAMLSLLADPARRQALAAAGQRHVASAFSHATMLNRYEAIYRAARADAASAAILEESVCAE